MARMALIKMSAILTLILGAELLSAATVTYVVGNCLPGLPSFPTISAALAAPASPNVVKVCPGTYPEQVVITFPVTLLGLSSGNSGEAMIVPPSSGLVVNARDDMGNPVAAQVLVQVPPGPNVFGFTDLTVDGTGNGIGPGAAPVYITGIFAQNSSGTINRATIRHQSGNGFGIGIWAEGGGSNPTLTIENSSIHDIDNTGFLAEVVSGELLTAIVVGSQSSGSGEGKTTFNPFRIGSEVDANLSKNVIVQDPGSSVPGILIGTGATGSVSSNTIVNGAVGIDANADGVRIIGNQIFNAATGILLTSQSAPVQGNKIVNSQIAINLNCLPNPNVRSNQITDAAIGLDQVPSGTGSGNSFFGVATEAQGGCPAAK